MGLKNVSKCLFCSFDLPLTFNTSCYMLVFFEFTQPGQPYCCINLPCTGRKYPKERKTAFELRLRNMLYTDAHCRLFVKERKRQLAVNSVNHKVRFFPQVLI